MSLVVSIAARTQEEQVTPYSVTDLDDVAAMIEAAQEAGTWLGGIGRLGRRDLLVAMADALESRAEELAEVADRETGLGLMRLRGEVSRTAYQLRFQGEVTVDGGYLEATIDHPRETDLGSQPDLRRTHVPVGTVLVFGPSNFPLAFGVAGGDTASALAAGCPVIAKAHASHPQTSGLVGDIIADVLATRGAPAGVLRVIFGRAAGSAAVDSPGIAAIGFTGSLVGGRVLADRAARRPNPIPFHGELGSVNTFVVTQAAARSRAQGIGEGVAASMTMGMGQFCTKPGVLLVPSGHDGDLLRDSLVAALNNVEHGVLLNEGTRISFLHDLERLADNTEVKPLLLRSPATTWDVSPVLLETTADFLVQPAAAALREERFGPFAVLARYDDNAEVEQVLEILPPALTGSLHFASDDPDLPAIAAILQDRVGRVVFNGYPTGVAVSWAMQHGGPFPASTTPSTSVGGASLRRWIRPITYQDAPESVLPDELREHPCEPLVRRVDGLVESGAK